MNMSTLAMICKMCEDFLKIFCRMQEASLATMMWWVIILDKVNMVEFQTLAHQLTKMTSTNRQLRKDRLVAEGNRFLHVKESLTHPREKIRPPSAILLTYRQLLRKLLITACF